MTTHDLGQARRLAGEILFLHRGRLLEHAPAAAFFAGPRSRKRLLSCAVSWSGDEKTDGIVHVPPIRPALLAGAVACCALPRRQRAGQFITVASTTSTEQSGLFGHLLPIFTAKTGIEVRVVALGTGQALDVGRRGDADVVFVHDRRRRRASSARASAGRAAT